MSLKRLYIWLPLWLALLALLALVAGGVGMVRDAAEGELSFRDASCYRDMVLARSLTQGHYGVSAADPAPARSPLWHAVLAAGGLAIANWEAALVLTGLALVAVALVCIPSLCRSADRGCGLPGLIVALAWLVASPGIFLGILAGRSATLAVLLAALGSWAYFASLADRRAPGLAAGVCLALAVAVEPLFLIFWVVLGLHALLHNLVHGPGRVVNILAAAVRTANGLILAGIVLMPAVTWNLVKFDVPWLRIMEAPLAADMWGIDPRAAMTALTDGWYQRYSEAWASWAAVIPGGPRYAALLAILAVAVMSGRIFRRRPMAIVTLPLLFLVGVPLLYALAAPFIGDGGWPALTAAGLPLLALIPAAAVGDLAGLFRGRGPWVRLAAAVPPVLLALLLLWPVLRIGTQVRAYAAEAAEARERREDLKRALRAENITAEDTLATDEAGWWVWVEQQEIIDLRGYLSIEAGMVAGIDRRWDDDRVRELARGRQPAAAAIYHPRYSGFAEILPGRQLPPDHGVLVKLLETPAGP